MMLLISSIIFLFAGLIVLLYFLRILIIALPTNLVTDKFKFNRINSLVANNQKLYDQLEQAKKKNNPDNILSLIAQVLSIKSKSPHYIEEIQSTSKLYFQILDLIVYLLELEGVRYLELEKLENLIQERNDSFVSLKENLSIQQKLQRKVQLGESPKDWAIKELVTKEKLIRNQLVANNSELQIIFDKIKEEIKNNKTKLPHKFH